MTHLKLDRRLTRLQRQMNVTNVRLQLGEPMELLQPAIAEHREEGARCTLHFILMSTAPVLPILEPEARN